MGTVMDEESRKFLLEEYKAAWEMVKYLSQQRDKWMKYYFTIVAAVFSYIGYALRGTRVASTPFTGRLEGRLYTHTKACFKENMKIRTGALFGRRLQLWREKGKMNKL